MKLENGDVCYSLATVFLVFHLLVATAVSAENLGQEDSETKNNGGTKHGGEDDAKFKGHLKSFGESGSQTQIKETSGFPTDFFLDYVLTSQALLMKGAATVFPAYRKWTDDYLLRLSSTEDNRNVKVGVEIGKKELRNGEGLDITFHEFLKLYNKTDMYMVTDIVPFLEPFLTMPCPLQCPEMSDVPTNHVMWFSSGGTKSVVHTDGEDNINCLLRGNKTLFMLDPSRISTGSVIDTVQGAYSKLDVDKVDLNLYPTLKVADFVIAKMEPGDCLYIPRHWLHQVRSYGSNLAVNVWFHHKQTVELLRKGYCTGPDIPCDPTFTLGRVQHPRLMEEGTPSTDGHELLRGFFQSSSIRGESSVSPENPPLVFGEEKVKVEEFITELSKESWDPFTVFEEDVGGVYEDKVQKENNLKEYFGLIRRLDTNSDGVLTSFEFEEGIGSLWMAVVKMLKPEDLKLRSDDDDDNDINNRNSNDNNNNNNNDDDDDDEDEYYMNMNEKGGYEEIVIKNLENSEEDKREKVKIYESKEEL